jgi:hypothetical protein
VKPKRAAGVAARIVEAAAGLGAFADVLHERDQTISLEWA